MGFRTRSARLDKAAEAWEREERERRPLAREAATVERATFEKRVSTLGHGGVKRPVAGRGGAR